MPLSRPLHMVDPSVRALSAYAQGLASPSAPMGAGGIAGAPTKSVLIEEGAITMVSQATDGSVVARQVLNGIGDALNGI